VGLYNKALGAHTQAQFGGFVTISTPPYLGLFGLEIRKDGRKEIVACVSQNVSLVETEQLRGSEHLTRNLLGFPGIKRTRLLLVGWM
jgi:hypothetical protein